MPYCPHCNRNTFEILPVVVAGTQYSCVQRSGCKAPFISDHRLGGDQQARDRRPILRL